MEVAKGLWKKGDTAGGVRLLQEKVRAGKAEAADYAFLGTLLALQGENLQALDSYQEAAKLQPQSTLYLNNVSVMLYSLSRWDEARSWFEKVLAVDPQDPRAKSYIAMMSSAQKLHNEQMKNLRQRLEPKEKTFDEFLRVAQTYNRLGQWEPAEKYFKQADALNARSYDVKKFLARLAYRRKDFAAALQNWEQAADIAPTALEAQVETGRLYAATGRLREAARAWTRVAKLARTDQPEYKEAQYYLQNLAPFLN